MLAKKAYKQKFVKHCFSVEIYPDQFFLKLFSLRALRELCVSCGYKAVLKNKIRIEKGQSCHLI